MRYRGHLGPSAPWVDEEDIPFAENDPEHVLRSIASALATALERRAALLRASPTRELIEQEARAQIASITAYGDILGLLRMFDMYSEIQFSVPLTASPEDEPDERQGDTVWPSEGAWPSYDEDEGV